MRVHPHSVGSLIIFFNQLVCYFPEDTKKGSMVEDFVAVVRGGSSESITALLSKKLPSPQLMRLWGEGVRYNPDFIRMKVRTPPLLMCNV